MVSCSDTVIYPGAMMVKDFYTFSAIIAVFRSTWFWYLAYRAYLKCGIFSKD